MMESSRLVLHLICVNLTNAV